MTYKVTLQWNETHEVECETLDIADALARRTIAEHPGAYVMVAGDGFQGSYFDPLPFGAEQSQEHASA